MKNMAGMVTLAMKGSLSESANAQHPAKFPGDSHMNGSADDGEPKTLVDLDRKIKESKASGVRGLGATVELTHTQVITVGNQKLALNDGEFHVGDRIIFRVPRALYCFDSRSKIRKTAAKVSEHRAFDTVIIIFILANCICMALRDYTDRGD